MGNQDSNSVAQDESSRQAEVLKNFRPNIQDVMAHFFKDWQFELQGEPMDSESVFSDVGFMPLIAHATQSFFMKNFSENLPRGLFEVSQEDVDGSIFGMRSIINMDLAKPHQAVLITLVMTHCCCDIFGNDPCHIDLNELIEWASNEALQQEGLPDLAKKYAQEPD